MKHKKSKEPEVTYVDSTKIPLPAITKVPAKLIIHDSTSAVRRGYGYDNITVDYKHAKRIMEEIAEALCNEACC